MKTNNFNKPLSEATETEAFVSHKKKKNGAVQMRLHPHAVSRFDDENGNVRASILRSTEKDECFEMSLGGYTATVFKPRRGKKITLSNGVHTVAWEYVPKPSADEDGIKKKRPRVALERSGQGERESFTYRNIDTATDLEYFLDRKGIKENIIVKEMSGEYRYTFLLRTGDLSVRISEDDGALELYEAKSGEDAKTLFTIPAPFMTDADGARSDDVWYELEEGTKGKYTFTVVADDAWINDSYRAFPVTIDPQLVIQSNDSVEEISNLIRYTAYAKSFCSSGTEIEETIVHNDMITISHDDNTDMYAVFSFPGLSDFLKDKKPISTHLVLRSTNSYHRFFANGSLITVNGSTARINLKTLLANRETLQLYPATDSYRSSTFYGLGSDYEPYIEVKYLIDSDYTPATVNLPTPAGTAATLTLRTGDIMATFEDTPQNSSPLGVSVSHVFNPDESNNAYGIGFRLNVDEHLVKYTDFVSRATADDKSRLSAFDYVYTDGNGYHHGFEEYFYYIENGERKYISSSAVTVDAEGNLTYNSHEVTRELRSSTGWEATTRLKNVKNLPIFEERTDEEKQLEEQVKNYKNVLEDYVIIHPVTGQIKETITSPSWSRFGSRALTECELLLPSSDAHSYRSMILQKEILSSQKQAYELQAQSLDIQKEGLELQKRGYDSQMSSTETAYKKLYCQLLHDEKMCTYYAKNASAEANAAGTSWPLASVVDYTNENESEWMNSLELGFMNTTRPWRTAEARLLYDEASASTLTPSQYQLLLEQKRFTAKQLELLNNTDANVNDQTHQLSADVALVEKQLSLYEEQCAKILSKKEEYLSNFREILTAYEQLSAQLAALRAALPVSYLRKDGIIKGFNKSGELCAIFDSYENYVVFDRNSSGLIESISDKNSNAITFTYDRGKLVSLTDTAGNRVNYVYDDTGKLLKACFSGGKELSFSYTAEGSISEIASRASRTDTTASDFTKVNFTYSNGQLDTAALFSLVETVPFRLADSNTETLLSSITITYGNTETLLIDEQKNKSLFGFDDEDVLVYHYREQNGVVVEAERYEHEYDSVEISSNVKTTPIREVVVRADEASLYESPLTDYTFADGESKAMTLNAFRQPSTEIVTHTSEYDDIIYLNESVTAYTYDNEHRLAQKSVSVSIKNTTDNSVAFSETSICEYFYNANGKIVRTENYVSGKEDALGRSIEETVYDENGHVTKSFTYNTLSPSDKVYTENDVDENGRTLADFDVTGKNKTCYSYFANGTLATEHFPNGAAFGYAYDRGGTQVSITASTEDGESNTNTTHYTAGLATHVASGNNSVSYHYDEKRRVKSVSLNGADPYVNYTYSGENTNAETVTVTMADGTESTVVKNRFGNTVETACSDRTVATEYTKDQKISAITDSVSGKTEYTYTANGDVKTVKVNEVETESYSYDAKNMLTRKTINGITYTFTPKADMPSKLDSITVDGTTVRPQTDALGRSTGKTIAVGDAKIAEEKISYIKFGDHATSLPSTVRFAENGVFRENIQYRYDNMGNIIEVFENGRSVCRYEYDTLGRLTREDSVTFSKTTTWAYDNNGNILARYEYALTAKPTNELHLLDCVVFDYCYADNSDQLVSFKGEAFVYDKIGNPTTYRGKTATWAYGRQLTSYEGNTFSYDARGRRIAKNGITFTYDSNGNLIKQSNGLEFLYDHTGVFAVKYAGSTYFYRKNAQNDIIALLDNMGTVVVKYKYDAWGNGKVLNASGTEITDTNNIGILNPFRYRGYYYDTETNLYFLKTRYYDPQIGRFMTIDDLSYLDPNSINGLNLYAYCGNNPIMYSDPNGTLKWYHLLGIIGAVIVFAAATVLTCGAAGIAIGGAGLAGAVIHGAAVGALIGAGVGVAGGAIAGGIYSAVTGADFWSSVGAGAMAGFGIGAIIGAVVGGFAGARGWYNARALEFTNLGTNDEVVLGKYIHNSPHSYDAVAQSRGSTYFGTSQTRWAEVQNMFGVGEKGMWKINKAFLKQQIKAGKQFVITNDYIFGYLFKEVSYITSKGISLFLI